MNDRRRQLKREYLNSRRPAGVFQIRNRANEKIFVGSSANLSGIFNRHEFQLKNGGHPNKSLQADWNRFGAANFVFEILEEIVPRDYADYDLQKDLEVFEDLWLEKLSPFGERGYNERKKSRDEKLRMISDSRLKSSNRLI